MATTGPLPFQKAWILFVRFHQRTPRFFIVGICIDDFLLISNVVIGPAKTVPILLLHGRSRSRNLLQKFVVVQPGYRRLCRVRRCNRGRVLRQLPYQGMLIHIDADCDQESGCRRSHPTCPSPACAESGNQAAGRALRTDQSFLPQRRFDGIPNSGTRFVGFEQRGCR